MPKDAFFASVCLSVLVFSADCLSKPSHPFPTVRAHVRAHTHTHTHTHTQTSFAADPKIQAERISPFLAKQQLLCMPRSKVRMWSDSEGLSGSVTFSHCLSQSWWLWLWRVHGEVRTASSHCPEGPPGSAKGQLWWRLWDGGVSLPRPGWSFWLWCF